MINKNEKQATKGSCIKGMLYHAVASFLPAQSQSSGGRI